MTFFSHCQTSLGGGSNVQRTCSGLPNRLYSTTNGAAIDCVAEKISSLKNRPFVAYYLSAQNYLFLRISVVGTKGNIYDSVCAFYGKNGETPLQAALHTRQKQDIAAGGIVAVEAVRDRAVKSETRAMLGPQSEYNLQNCTVETLLIRAPPEGVRSCSGSLQVPSGASCIRGRAS